jgi:hypothetical protein
MKHLGFLLVRRAVLLGCAILPLVSPAAPPASNAKKIPDALQPWESWATWGDDDRLCPTPYSDSKKHLCFWPSRLYLQVDRSGGKFDLDVTVFQPTWVPLPGGRDVWPQEVKAGGAAIPVLEHNGAPAVQLQPGKTHFEGLFRWSDVPQRIPLPKEIGVLSLVLDGQPVEAPIWDAQGDLWLKRNNSGEEADKNFLAVKIYAALEDGVPLWLRTDIELTVSGKSREEDLGTALPQGWKLAAVDSPIPVSIDDAGNLKAQVRTGKWVIQAHAFRFDNPKEFRYAEGARPAAPEELVAFRARPDFRTVEIIGSPSIDISQTTFPQKWRNLPVYRWDTATPFHLEERLRGMGEEKSAGLSIVREFWLDENGHALTFRDQITGQMQHIWRLDTAEGQNVGSVRSNGQGQLITRNPQNGATGVEIRTRYLNLEAAGRATQVRSFSATGWRTDADSLTATLNLPPGWRLFALFGADWVQGDWLTSWTLLDLFLLLIFSLAVFRLWGFGAGLLAFVGFGLSFHEVDAPRYTWLILLVPLALDRVVPPGWGRRIVDFGKWLAIAAFLLVFIPFIAGQLELALYPQLEFRYLSTTSASTPDFIPQTPGANADAMPAPTAVLRKSSSGSLSLLSRSVPAQGLSQSENLSQAVEARIQTGPGVPDWRWREVTFGWNGPVSAAQQVRPILISGNEERILTIARVFFLVLLAAVIFSVRQWKSAIFRRSAKFAFLLAFFCAVAHTSAQAPIPDQATLNKLRERLLEVSDAYPTAADIPSVSFKLTDRKITLDAEIHAAIRTAVPLPGRLPTWSPITVLVDDKPEAALRRDDGYLWVVIDPGVHRVRVEGSLASVTEWEWTFALKPRQVKIDAPDWTITGLPASGVPEAQVFFSRKQKAAASAASYDRQEVQSVVQVNRSLEIGLIWQVHTTVQRLSPLGKAVALRVPLLPGESVLSSNALVKDGLIEVRLGAQDPSFSWDSSLAIVNTLSLTTRRDDTWVEHWRLLASPVWNIAISGLPPVFEPRDSDLVPVWQPWPGESVQIAISRPEAIAGATVTVDTASHEITLGQRERTVALDLSLRCSLGEDFPVDLPPDAQVTTLTQNGASIPVRKDGQKLIISAHPGAQRVSIAWKSNLPLTTHAQSQDVRLPVESANIQTTINVPDNRWVLWTYGPRRGPAVRFWGVLLCSLLAAIILSRLSLSPIRTIEWLLLSIGLTQVPLFAAFAVVGWLFLLAWRRTDPFQQRGYLSYNTLQIFLIALTIGALGILISAVGEGLLGNPEMFITGNGSTRNTLRWFQPRTENLLPSAGCISISIWWYRFFMLLWALWLAGALLRWLRQGWTAFSTGGYFRRKTKKSTAPPPLPTTSK